MATRSRKKPAPLTRARRTEVPDVLGSTAAESNAVDVIGDPTRSAPVSRRSQNTQSAAEQTSTPEVEAEAVAPAAEPKRRRKAQTVIFDVDILDRARAAVTHLAAYEPEAGVKSLPDLVNPALAASVDKLEKKYNGGKPFRRVARMQTGRPASS